jgi:hypothetical protein
MATEVHPPPEEDPFRADLFRAVVAEEIGYSVISRGSVGLIFGAFLAATLALGIGLRRSRRPELLGWLAPAAALAATAAFLALGESSRRAAAPTVAVAQVVEAVPGMPEAELHGLLAVYRPDSGPAQTGAAQGGLFELDMSGIEGQTRRLILTDMDAWHWDNLALPAGVRLASFRYTTPTREPVRAVAHFGAEGVEGQLAAGPFGGLADALLATPSGRNLSVRLQPDGAFTAGTQDILPTGEFLASAVLSDRQQRRHALYREFLKQPGTGRTDRNLLLVWADPIDMSFTLDAGARTVGTALLVVPLQLQRPAAGTRVTIPGPLIPYKRIVQGAPARPTLDSSLATDMQLRFQIPPEVLPLKVERVRLLARIDAPSRRVTFAAHAKDGPVEVHRVESPIAPIRVDITEERLLYLDDRGGLHMNVTISNPLGSGVGDQGAFPDAEKWTMEYIELEVSGLCPE